MDQNTTNNAGISKMTKEYAAQLKARSYYITIKSLQLYMRALRDTIDTIDAYVSCTKDKKPSLKELCHQCRVTGSILPDNKYRSCDKHISTLRSDIVSLNIVCNSIDDFDVNTLINLLCCIIETADNADESTELKNHALAIMRKFMLTMLVTCTTLYYTKKTKHAYLGKLTKQNADLISKYGNLHCLIDALAVKMHEAVTHDRIMGYSEDHTDNLAIEYVEYMNEAIFDYVSKINER